MLSTIARLFDPLGLLAPFVVTAQILMQKCIRQQRQESAEDEEIWDAPLPCQIASKWGVWFKDPEALLEVRIERVLVAGVEGTLSELIMDTLPPHFHLKLLCWGDIIKIISGASQEMGTFGGLPTPLCHQHPVHLLLGGVTRGCLHLNACQARFGSCGYDCQWIHPQTPTSPHRPHVPCSPSGWAPSLFGKDGLVGGITGSFIHGTAGPCWANVTWFRTFGPL